MPAAPFDVPFGALDTKTDERMLPNGALLVAENCSAQTVGGYRKRFGYTQLGALSGGCLRLAALGDSICAVQETTGDLRSWDSATSQWRTMTKTVPLSKTTQEIVSAKAGTDAVAMSVAVANGVKVDVWIDSVGVVFVAQKVVADGAKAAIAQAFSATGNRAIRAVTVGTNVYIVVSNAVNQVISGVFVNCTTGVVGSQQVLFSGANVDVTNAQFDLSPLDSTDVVLVWKTNAAVVRAARITASTSTVNANQQIAAEAPDGPIACVATTGEAGFALYHSTAGGGMRGVTFNAATMVTSAGPYTVEAVTTPVAVNCALIRDNSFGTFTSVVGVWDRAASGTTKGFVRWARFDSAGSVDTLRGPIRNVLLISKMINVGRYLVNFYQKSTAQETYFTYRIDGTGNATLQAMHAYRTAYTNASTLGVLSDMTAVGSANVFNAPLGYKTLAAASANAAVATFGIDTTSADRCSSEQIRGQLAFAGGVCTRCDGRAVAEMNFLVYPEILSATPGSVASGGMDNGAYVYTAIFEAIDSFGNVDRSTPALQATATTTAGAGLGKVTVVLDQLHMTRVDGSIGGTDGKVSLFRSLKDAEANADGSFTFYFVGSAAISQASATVTITDQANDSTIQSNRLLYTDGGVIEREAPPPSLQLVLHKNRLWGISSADRKVVFYSGQLTLGEGAWFSSEQQIRIDAGGDLTALASMDDKLIAFKADRVFKIYGNGADALGQNNDLTEALLVTGDAGCTDHRSIVMANGGLLFKSAKGVYGLSRAEELSYAGENGDAYWSNYTNIVAANMLTDRQELRFEVSGGAGVGDAITGSAIAAQKLVLNYVTGQWTTHRNYLDGTAIDARVAGGVYYWATSGGAVYKENAASFLDPSSTFVRMLIRTGWIKPAGFQGWVRARRSMLLNARKTDHALTMFCENDYLASTTTTKSWTAAQIATFPNEQVDLHLIRQKGESYRFTVYDGSDGTVGTGEGTAMFGLQLYAQALRGTFEKKLLAAARG